MIDYSKRPDWFYDPSFWRPLCIAAKKDLEEAGEKMSEEWKKQFYDSISGSVDELIENVRSEVGILTGAKAFNRKSLMGNPVEPAPGTSMHRDPVGPDGPSGDNWQERLSREYHDTKVRYELLHIHNVKEKAKRAKEVYDVSTPEQKNSQELLFRQENIMREYLDVLEIRMAMAGLAI